MKNIETNSGLLSEPIFQQPSKDAYQSGCVSWIVESVVFPDGTEFRGKYKEFVSPCEAALTITRTPIDGWLFWDCKLPGQLSWMNISELKS